MKTIGPRFRTSTLSLLAAAFAVWFASAPTASAVDGTWNGTTDGVWATTTNWSASPVPTGGQTATFNNAGNGNTTLDLGAGVGIGSITFDTSSAAAYTIGSGGAGAQTLTISHSGVIGLTATAGNDQVINANLLLGNPGGSGWTYLTNNSTTQTLTLNGGVSGNGSGAKKVLSDGTGNVVVNGAISAGTVSMNFEQVGTGNTTLAGVNSFTGVTDIRSGTLTLSGNLTGGTAIVLSGPSSGIGGTGSLIQGASSVISGATSITSAGNMALVTSNVLAGNNTYTGLTTIQYGVWRLLHSNALGSTANGTTVGGPSALELAGDISIGAEALSLGGSGIANTGALRNISGNNTFGGAVTIGAAFRINSDAGTLTLTGNITGGGWQSHMTLGGAGNIAISGNIGDNSNPSRKLFKDGTGIATISGSNTYLGTTTVSAGILTFGQTGAKASNTVTAGAAGTIGLGVGGAGYYSSANVDSLFANTLTGFSMNAASGVAIDTSAGDFSHATDQGGTRSLTKLGANALTLSGTSGYTGATVVSAGTLIIEGSLTSTSSASVASGAFLNVNGNVSSAVSVNGTLSGTGTVGAVTVASGGVLAPGNSAGILNATSLSGTSGAVLSMEVGKSTGGVDPIAGTNYDQVNSSGGVTLGGMTLDLTPIGTAPIDLGDKIFLVLNGSVDAVGGTFAGLAQDAVFLFNSQNYQISYVADWTGNYATSNMVGGNDIALLTVVPEPSTWALLGATGTILILFRRRRSQCQI